MNEYKPMSHCCHGYWQVASNRDACFYSPDNWVHAGSVCKLWRGVGGQSRDRPGSFRVLGVAVELEPQQQLPCPLAKGRFRRYTQTKDTGKVRHLKEEVRRERKKGKHVTVTLDVVMKPRRFTLNVSEQRMDVSPAWFPLIWGHCTVCQ